MNTNVTNQNQSELGNDNGRTSAIAASVPDEGKSAEMIRPHGKRRESFLNSLMRAFSAVAC